VTSNAKGIILKARGGVFLNFKLLIIHSRRLRKSYMNFVH